MRTYRAWLASALLLPILAGCGKSTPAEPDAFAKEFTNTVANGDLGDAWNYLPPKYQSDVTKLVHDAASNIDAEVYDKGFALTGKLALLLKSKKDFLLKSETVGQMPKEQKEKMEANWQSLVDALETLSNSEIKTVDGLKKVDPGAFLGSTGNKLFALAKTAPDADKNLAKLKTFKATKVKEEGDTATLKMEMEGQPTKEEQFKKVEGKWLPKDMVDDWDKSMKEARDNLAKLKLTPEQKTMALNVIKQVETALDRLLAANDQATFDKEIGELTGAVMGAALMGAGGPPASPVLHTSPAGPNGVPFGAGPAATALPGTPAVPGLPK
jgi:hypothetical protein